ncbi:MAG: MotA/TolQ/ExbB proton channel family protein [Lyngbya sp. HA4199-MV5]|jgi:biopolymer transport protein ExbB|nr:MotA/TolQ/ExbB proton channel family protein [Lyngbya sp. HA4199-MV5]
MSTVFDLVAEGGPVMVPLAGLSIATIACAIERSIFWFQLPRSEDRIVHDVLEAAHYDLAQAADMAHRAHRFAIGRYLFAPLRLSHPTPDTFHLALENAAEKEFIRMHRGDKLLESVVGLAPLLGLLGTVTGLITTFNNLKIGGGVAIDTAKATAGIGEALTATAGGMLVAILALVILRIFLSFQTQQRDYFSTVGGDLELVYRQLWYDSQHRSNKHATPNWDNSASLQASDH